MSKKCGVCGETVPSNVIECPKCGRGVFETEKLHRDSVDTIRDVSSTAESHTGKRRKHLAAISSSESNGFAARVRYMVVLGDGFTPTRSDITQAGRIWREAHPDHATGCIATALEWPGGLPRDFS